VTSGVAGTTGAGASYGGGTGTAGTSGGYTAPASTFASLRKVKNVLTGLAPTDAEVASVTNTATLQTLINTWMGTPEFQSKMILFLQNAFQQ
jgi:hypothetical protein